MGGVRGILLDSSTLFAEDDYQIGNENASLRPGAEYLLRKLHHSKIPTIVCVLPSDNGYIGPPLYMEFARFSVMPGICYGLGLSATKVNLIERMSRLYTFSCFLLNPPSVHDIMNEIAAAWVDNGGSFVLVVSNHNKDLFLFLSNSGWLTVILNVEGGSASEDSSTVFINKLAELPMIICHLNRKVASNSSPHPANCQEGHFILALCTQEITSSYYDIGGL
ncbi:unnamed protein product [Ilex paraguariensis]|uniref:Uncharacterized protein n=1 Tax=Ilex paraguariensis TaxID=185542 RepID=A0ABC8QZ22_9AQUA